MNKNYNDYCHECGGWIISSIERGEKTCSSCGLVIEERLPIDPNEYQAYNFRIDKENDKRTDIREFNSRLSNTHALGSKINQKDSEKKDRKKYYHLNELNKQLNSEERSYSILYRNVSHSCTRLQVPKTVRLSALNLTAKVHKRRNEILGSHPSSNTLAAALIFLSSRMLAYPISIDTLKKHCDKPGILFPYYRKIALALKIRPTNQNYSINISKICCELNLGKIEIIANKMINALKNKKASSPRILAGAAVYYACKIKDMTITQSEIAKIVDASDVSIRTNYKYLKKVLNL